MKNSQIPPKYFEIIIDAMHDLGRRNGYSRNFKTRPEFLTEQEIARLNKINAKSRSFSQLCINAGITAVGLGLSFSVAAAPGANSLLSIAPAIAAGFISFKRAYGQANAATEARIKLLQNDKLVAEWNQFQKRVQRQVSRAVEQSMDARAALHAAKADHVRTRTVPTDNLVASEFRQAMSHIDPSIRRAVEVISDHATAESAQEGYRLVRRLARINNHQAKGPGQELILTLLAPHAHRIERVMRSGTPPAPV